MKLVFYSGGQNRSNHRLHRALAQLAGRKKRKSFTYIPVWSDGSHIFYNRIVKRFKKFGFTDFCNLPVDQPVSPKLLKRALKSDVVYLAGGNTFYYLKHLKKSGILPRLRSFARRGGVLAGLSAGGIILSPDIGLAAYPLFDADDNEVGLRKKDWKSLGLARFEFFPHFEDNRRLNMALSAYSRRITHPIFACPDGAGLTVNGSEMRFFGRVHMFLKGQGVVVSSGIRRSE